MPGKLRRAIAPICESLEGRRLMASTLTGTVIGTPGSYHNNGLTIAKAFDGDFNTYYDGASSDGNWVGLKLTTPATVTQVKYAPRATLQTRMVGGIFQGSNSADFSTGTVNLFTITAAPTPGGFTIQPVTSSVTFQYVRYLSPSLSYGNVTELEFDGVPVTTTGPAKIVGTVIGTAGSYKNGGATIATVFDGNLNTFFDGPNANGNYVGMAFSPSAIVTQVQFAPRSTYPGRMVGGSFQASNDPTFASGVVTLGTISATPVAGAMTVLPLANNTAYTYYRYLAPAGSYGNIAELEFDGTITAQTSNKLNGTVTGTAGSFGNSGNTIQKAFDSNLATYFDSASASGNIIADAFSSEAIISQIQFAPRSTFASRMVGGVFQGSNDPNFSAGVVNLYTVTQTPAINVMTIAAISNTSPYKYVRYLAPAGSYGNVAEIEFDGTLTGKQPPLPGNPSVTSSNPANNATNVDPNSFISCALNLPNFGAGVNVGTMSSSTVYLYRTFDHSIIATQFNTDAAGSVIVLQPETPLDANTNYTFVITAGVKDGSGAAFVPYQISFTTGNQTVPTDPTIAFQKVALTSAKNQSFSGVTMGPDGNLYACTVTGNIFQFPVNPDGTLGNPTNLLAGAAARLITGIAFDPSSTAGSMMLWISSGAPQYFNAPDFSGNISAITITGKTASPVQDYIVGLPRSNSNHLNNQPVFGPDGALYWSQGSNSSMGQADSVWGLRPEHLLNAAILRLDVNAIRQYVAINHAPLNVQTDSLPAGQTPYIPYPSQPLTLYVTGIRNAYDLVWDTNGHLYVPTNGSAAGGNIPGTPAGVTPAAPAENNVLQAESDYLYDVTPGHYYGHPNPTRGEWIFGGGNPVNPAPNTAIQTAYPLGTSADPRYPGYAYDFGLHYSPDGAIQYTGNAFGGALNGAILVTRYSGGKDILTLRTGANGQITQAETGITGFTQFTDPVDITEDPATGNLYVADLGANSLVLLRPIGSGATISVSTNNLYFNDPVNTPASPSQSVTITNAGNQPLAIPATGLSIVGSDGSLFPISSKPQLPATIGPGQSITVSLVFNPGNSALGLHTAQLQIASNDPANPLVSISLRAITTRGLGGTLEPSLQAILNLFQIPINVGTADPTQTYFTTPPNTPNDEVVMPELQKAGLGQVTVTPIAVFSASITPSASFGYYTAGTPASRTDLFSINSADAQTVNPHAIGSTSFDPGSGTFGIYTSFDFFASTASGTPRVAYSEDIFNPWDTTNPRKVRFYPLKNTDGSVVPNAYIFATEDYGVAPNYDSNDVVGIIRNVMAAPAGPKLGTANVSGTNQESAPSPTRFVFNSIQNANATPPNVVHDTNTLRLVNSGNQPLIISSIDSSNSFFSISTPITYPLTIAAGNTLDLGLLYSPVHTGLTVLDNGTMTINSNDAASPALQLQMAGIWQVYGNQTPNGTYTEPTVQQIISTYGFGTTILNAGQSMNQNGQIQSVGQEILSTYWTRADTNLTVSVQQLSAFHTQGNAATLYWYAQGKSGTFNKIVTAIGDNAQSLLPLQNDTTKQASFGTFGTSGNFGFNVDKSEFSDNALNGHGGSLDQGHHMRFWPVYDATQRLIPNSYLMAMDYTVTGENYDYNDNVYLINNIKPA